MRDGVRTPARAWEKILAGLTAAAPPTEAGAIRVPTLIIYGGRDDLSLAGMAALGTALLQRTRSHAGFGFLRWPGWLNLGGAATLAGVLAYTGDIPPLFIYGNELATGAALVLRGRPEGKRTVPAASA